MPYGWGCILMEKIIGGILVWTWHQKEEWIINICKRCSYDVSKYGCGGKVEVEAKLIYYHFELLNLCVCYI
jgi:hypothetical protein